MNNAVVPLGLIVNLLLWGKDINYTNLLLGGGLILLALFIHRLIMERSQKTTPAL
jgi:hypothetical protein